MTIGTLDPGSDHFDLAVNFGGLQYLMFFGRNADRRLPSTPPPAASGLTRCMCPSCVNEGWYAVSPACKYWNVTCCACEGTRVVREFIGVGPPRRRPCDQCAEERHTDVARFRHALRNPRAAARRLREQAASARAAAMNAQ